MSGSAALAAAKRRRSGTDTTVNTIINSTGHPQGINSQSNKRVITNNNLTPIGAINLHEQKLQQLYNFHLSDKGRISDCEELLKELCSQHNTSVDEMKKMDMILQEVNKNMENINLDELTKFKDELLKQDQEKNKLISELKLSVETLKDELKNKDVIIDSIRSELTLELRKLKEDLESQILEKDNVGSLVKIGDVVNFEEDIHKENTVNILAELEDKQDVKDEVKKEEETPEVKEETPEVKEEVKKEEVKKKEVKKEEVKKEEKSEVKEEVKKGKGKKRGRKANKDVVPETKIPIFSSVIGEGDEVTTVENIIFDKDEVDVDKK